MPETQPYVTPLVASLAKQHNVDLATVQATGAGGRIRRDDILRAAGVLPPAASPAEEQARAINAQCAAVGLRTRRGGSSARGAGFALNPLVDQVRAEARAQGRPAPSTYGAPTLFMSGDLPAFTASGIPPEALLEVPWQARRAMAAARTPAEAYAIAEQCTGPDAADTAKLFYGNHPENEEYADRVREWQLRSMSNAELEVSSEPGAPGERARREAAGTAVFGVYPAPRRQEGLR